jgi:hypothetical protein
MLHQQHSHYFFIPETNRRKLGGARRLFFHDSKASVLSRFVGNNFAQASTDFHRWPIKKLLPTFLDLLIMRIRLIEKKNFLSQF